MKTNKKKCSKCGNYVKAEELRDISICNLSWVDICPQCKLIVDQEILDILENNTEVTGYTIIETELKYQSNLEVF